MNKDTVVASTIGFSLGLVAAIMLWVVPRIIPKTTLKPTPATTAQVVEETDDHTPAPTGLTITSPVDGEIVTDSSIKITGTAPAADTVTISSPEQSVVIIPEKNGEFSSSIKVVEGANQIVLSSFTKGQRDAKTLSVYHYGEGI